MGGGNGEDDEEASRERRRRAREERKKTKDPEETGAEAGEVIDTNRYHHGLRVEPIYSALKQKNLQTITSKGNWS